MTLPHSITVRDTEEGAPQQRSVAGPATPLEALQEFKKVQERRVAHWKEYDEALEVYERTNLNAESDDKEGHVASRDPGHAGQSEPGHRCGPTPSNGSVQDVASNHYHSVTTAMSDEVFSKILSLVTSGLLDCSHSVRAIETELRTALARPDLAQLVGRVQDDENAVLRSIVARDQSKRKAKLEGRDLTQEVARLDAQVLGSRSQIQETMDEIGAEMAELQFS